MVTSLRVEEAGESQVRRMREEEEKKKKGWEVPSVACA
jgi:hypothetical protein